MPISPAEPMTAIKAHRATRRRERRVDILVRWKFMGRISLGCVDGLELSQRWPAPERIPIRAMDRKIHLDSADNDLFCVILSF
ncbi:hypothetical protein [Acidovorax sp.]|uniref:hypothetical protein n=1 Tax=Acidovorax sp. TaxID=1872122 RepID=UPI003D017C14